MAAPMISEIIHLVPTFIAKINKFKCFCDAIIYIIDNIYYIIIQKKKTRV